MKTLRTMIFLLCCLCSVYANAYSDRDLLQKTTDTEKLKALLITDQEWVTYPAYTDRNGWDKLFGTTKEHPQGNHSKRKLRIHN